MDIVGHQSKTTRHFFVGDPSKFTLPFASSFSSPQTWPSGFNDLQKTKEVQGNLPWYRKKKSPPPFKKSKNFFLSKSLPPRTFLCEKKDGIKPAFPLNIFQGRLPLIVYVRRKRKDNWILVGI